MSLTIANFVLFYAAWFACVLSMSSPERWWWSVLGALAAVGFQVAVSRDRRRDLTAIACATLLGPLADVVLLYTGILSFPPSAPLILGTLPPLQMILLWSVFATTFFSSLHWLVSRPVWFVAGGAVGGPAAYYAGAQLVSGIRFLPGTRIGLFYIGIAWAVVLPIVLVATTRCLSLYSRAEAA